MLKVRLFMEIPNAEVYDSINKQLKKLAFKARLLAALRDSLGAGECAVEDVERFLKEYKI